MFGKLKALFSTDIGIDLGTANSLVYAKDRGIVLREPSVVAIQAGSKRVLAVGEEAKRMLGRTPGNIVAIRPMKSGVIADFDITEAMIAYFIKKVCPKRFYSKYTKPRMVIAVPSGITEVEKRAVEDAAHAAGAGDVFLIEEPMAAAIGVGLPVSEPAGSMIVDIGGGTSDIAVIALNKSDCNGSVRVGGDEMDEAIVRYLRTMYNLCVGESTAEQIKIQIGSASPLEEELTMEVKGLDFIAGMPRTIPIGSAEIREAINEPVTAIIEAVKQALSITLPELSADIYDKGIILTGGGSQLRGLDERIRKETGLSVNVIDDPMTCVCKGAARILEDLDKYRPVLVASST